MGRSEAKVTPRGLDRVEASAYIGIGVTMFEIMVNDGRMPRSKRMGSRKVWDRLALDKAFDALPDDAGNAARTSWDDVEGAPA